MDKPTDQIYEKSQDDGEENNDTSTSDQDFLEEFQSGGKGRGAKSGDDVQEMTVSSLFMNRALKPSRKASLCPEKS